MSKSRRSEKPSDIIPHVARASKKVALSAENRKARKQEAALWKRTWNEELLSVGLQ
jgi:hypothetical protein